MKKTGKIVGVALVLLLMAGIYLLQPKSAKRYTASYGDVFDTVTQFTGYAKSEKAFKKQADLLHEKLLRYHQLFDRYHTYLGTVNIKSINEAAGKKPVKVEAPLFDLLKLSKEMYTETGGKNNIAMGGVIALWHDCRERSIADKEKAKLPKISELKKQAKHMDMEKLVLDEEKQTVFLADPEMSLDVGSIGKGYAVELLGAYAKEQGITSMLINVGGNVLSLGNKESGEKWHIGIQNPANDQEYLCDVAIADACVVTSGDYQRYYVVDGKRYCHIIDPDTLMPPENFASISILAKKSGVADAFSTALFCMTYEEGRKLVESRKDVEALWVTPEGAVYYTDGFLKAVKSNKEKLTSIKPFPTFTIMVAAGYEKELFNLLSEEGLDKEEGFSLRQIEYENPVEDFRKGRIQLYVGSFSDVFRFRQEGMDACIVSQVCRDSAILSRKNSGVRSLRDLEGKTVVMPKQQDGYTLDYLFAQENIDPDSIKVVEVEKVEEMVEMLESKKALAALVTVPMADRLAEEGDHLLAKASEMRLNYGALLVNREAIKKDRKRYEAFLRAYKKAVNLTVERSNVAYVREYPYFAAPTREELWNTYQWAVQKGYFTEVDEDLDELCVERLVTGE